MPLVVKLLYSGSVRKSDINGWSDLPYGSLERALASGCWDIRECMLTAADLVGCGIRCEINAAPPAIDS